MYIIRMYTYMHEHRCSTFGLPARKERLKAAELVAQSLEKAPASRSRAEVLSELRSVGTKHMHM